MFSTEGSTLGTQVAMCVAGCALQMVIDSIKIGTGRREE